MKQEKGLRAYFVLIIILVLGIKVSAQNEPNDCIDAITVCGNGSFSSNAEGIGNIQEVDGCSGFEHNSLWLKINIVQSGTLGFDLIPDDTSILVDYDFWVYGPNLVCSNLGSPIRCATTNPNMAGLPNNHTGINGSTTLTQTGPGANGNGYVYWLNVNAGESYYIAIDRPEGEGGFELQWTGTAMEGAGAFPPQPEAIEIDDIKQCSSNPDIALFDLNGLKSDISSDLTNNTVEFYTSLADATDDINELPAIYANTSNPQQIFAKVKSNTTDCYAITDFNLIVTPIPDATISAPATSICEGEDITFEITGTPEATVHYTIDGGTTQDLLLDSSGVASFTETPSTDMTISLVNAQILSASNEIVCSQNLSETITVTVHENTVPTVTTNSPICEGENAVLDFSGDPNATITYSIDGGTSQSIMLDATGQFTLTLPTLTVDTEITIESVTNPLPPNCVLDLNTVELIEVHPLPVVNDPADLYACSDGVDPNTASFDLDALIGDISNNDPDLAVTFYESMPLAEAGDTNTALVSPYDSTSANQTLYIRVESDLGCVVFSTLELHVTDGPIANIPTPLEYCDDSNQGFGVFNLMDASTEISNGNTQPVEFLFYLTMDDAENNGPVIPNETAFQNTTPYNQTVYVSVSWENSDCANIVPLDLQVFDTPTVQSLQDLESCDTNQDGFAVFDLTVLNANILGSQDDNEHTITYYETEADANAPTANIPNPANYQNTVANSQPIWVRLENNTSECYVIASFFLTVDSPLSLDANYVAAVCDLDGDGAYTYNLNDYNSIILANTTDPSDYQVDFYPTPQDAIDNTGIITNPESFTAQASPQTTLGIRVTHILSACWSTAELTLDIIVLPDANQTTVGPLESCDVESPNDGTEAFDLTQFEDIISNGITNLSFSYHNTQNDAETGDNPISNPDDYPTASTTVYIRVTVANSSDSACYTVFPLEIIVNSLPTAELNELTACSTGTNGFYAFDLSAEIDSILGANQSSADFTVSFYEDVSTTNLITQNPYTNTTAYNQTIYVEVINTSTQCSIIAPLDLFVEEGATATEPDPVHVCDDDGTNDGFYMFDLTSLDTDILNGQNPNQYEVSYYLDSIDAQNGDNPIGNPQDFENTTAYQQTIYVRVINTNMPDACFATTSFEYIVNPVLKPVIASVDGSNTICVDFETNELQNTVTLFSDLQNANYTYQWYLNGTAISGATQATHTVNTVAPGTYTLTVTEINSVSGCTSQISDGFEVIQSGQAVFVSVSQSGTFHPNPSITITVAGYGDYWFQLDDGPIVDNGGVFTNVSGGLHTVYVYDRKTENPSCGYITIEDIRIIDYPKFFTPNDDGQNDTWNIWALSEQKLSQITIFDRYGSIMAVIQPSRYGWDGTRNGVKLPSSDYWFVLDYEEFGQPKQFRSHFTLKR